MQTEGGRREVVPSIQPRAIAVHVGIEMDDLQAAWTPASVRPAQIVSTCAFGHE
jgi:hypothetical protein